MNTEKSDKIIKRDDILSLEKQLLVIIITYTSFCLTIGFILPKPILLGFLYLALIVNGGILLNKKPWQRNVFIIIIMAFMINSFL